MSDVVFETERLTFAYPGAARAAVDDVSIGVRRGEMIALIGPNGSGKSTLLRLLLGALRAQHGSVRFDGRAVHEWPREEMARRIGVVTQAEELAFPITVRELVAMGRYPHLGAWQREAAADRAAIVRAMQRCEVYAFADRDVQLLSGGERQRARLARALAQEPRTLVFDEPTAALDIAHEMALFELLHELRGDGVTIVIAIHNLNVAARYADRLLLLGNGRVAALGSPAQVLTREMVERVYGWPVEIGEFEGAPQVFPGRYGDRGGGDMGMRGMRGMNEDGRTGDGLDD